MNVSFISPPTTNPPSFFTKSAKSIGAGLVTSAGIFGAGISGIILANIPPHKGDAYLVGVSVLSLCGGLYSAGKKFFSLSEKSCSPIILDSPQTEMQSLEKTARALKNGLKAYGISFLSSIIGAGIYHDLVRPRWMNSLGEQAVLTSLAGISAIIGIGTAMHTRRSLLHSSTQAKYEPSPSQASFITETGTSQAANTPSSSQSSFITGTETSKTPNTPSPNSIKTLIKITKALADGLATSAGIFTIGFSGAVLADMPPYIFREDYFPNLCFFSLICGFNSAKNKYSSLSKTASFQPPSQVKKPTILEKTTKALKSGLQAYGISFISSVIGVGIYNDLVEPKWVNRQSEREILTSLVGISALVGLGSAIREYSSLSQSERAPSFMERWRGISTKKKACILAGTALTATSLGILYVGPDKVIDKIKEVAQNIYTEAENQFHNMSYTSKTQTFSKPKSEWVKNYSDADEMDRLINLPEDASCAEILFTCDIDPDDLKTHKKAWKDKLLKFHTDKYNGEFKDRAEQSAKVLNRASDIMKNTKQCPGKDDEGCYDFDDIIEITKTRKDPNAFGKAMGIDPICTLQSGDYSAKVPIDQCSDVT